MACFCCQRENGLLVADFPPGTFDTGRFTLAFSAFVPPVPPCGMASACGCGSLPGPAAHRFQQLPRTVGALHAHIVLFRSRDFLRSFPSAASPGASGPHGTAWRAAFSTSSSTSLVVTLPVPRSPLFAAPAFSSFRRLVCFCLTAARSFTYGWLLQRRVSPFLVCKRKRGSLRIPATAIRSSAQVSHRIYRNLNGFCRKDRCVDRKAPSGFLLPCPDPESGCP